MQNAKYKALYVDTIASAFLFEINEKILSKYNYIIIDTTCFLGKEFCNMIECLFKKNIPCILVRSHTKLDLIGTEYSHIGSITFIKPDYLENDIEENFKNVESSCKHLIGVYGACLIPEKFPSFMVDEELKKLNEKRINTVAENTVNFCEILKSNGIKCELPNHKQFCLIYLGNKDIKLEELKQEIIDFCNTLNSNGSNVYHAVSFGFDYIAIDCYQNFLDGTFKIRVCLNDEESESIYNFSEKFLNFLNK